MKSAERSEGRKRWQHKIGFSLNPSSSLLPRECPRLCKQAKGKMPGQRLVGKQASQSQGLATWLAALCKVGKGKKEKKKSKKGKEKEKKGKDENRKRGKVPGQGLPGNTVGCSVV